MRGFWIPVLALCAGILTGCSGMPYATQTMVSSNGAAGATLRGIVHGGQQPIVGASIYLLAASSAGYGNASVSLLNGPGYVTTGAGGAFSITNDFTCPSGNSQVYLYSVGGNAGSGTNPSVGLLAALGPCDSLSSSTFVTVNEVSTIAMAYAVASFATDALHVGSTSSVLGQTDIANAFAAVANLETLGTGVALATTPAGNGTAPQVEINTLADVLAACINSTGPGSTACSTLFGDAMNGSTAPSDTATAAINIAHNPAANPSGLFSLQTPAAPFQPALSAAPNDFTVAITYTGGGLDNPGGLAIDGAGNVWVENAGSSGISKFSPVGTALSGAGGYTGGGLTSPVDIAIDASGRLWATNSSSPASISELNNSGSAVSSDAGYTGGGLSSPYGIAIDASNDVWVANYGGDISKFASSGSPTSSTGFSLGGLNGPDEIAVDTSGNIWANNLAGPCGIIELDFSGFPISPAAYSGGGLSYSYCYGLAIDGAGNIWASGFDDNAISGLDPSGTAIQGSPFSGGGLNGPVGIAIDGAGNIWVGNQGNCISEFSSNGTAISGAQGYTAAALNDPLEIAIDGSGNVWAGNYAAATITEFVGAATPVVTPIVANLLPPYGASAVSAPYSNTLALPPANPASLPPAALGKSYTGSIEAAGGVAPYTWSINGTAVTAGGLALTDSLTATSSGSLLIITGTPGTAEAVTLADVKVVDAENASASKTYTVAVDSTGTYTISGTITGLTSSGLVMQDDGGDNLLVNAGSTAFTFATSLGSGAAYSVNVLTQPYAPAQTCAVTFGEGTVGSANISNVQVVCINGADAYTIGGTVNGLAGTGLVLLDNGGNNLSIAPGATTFTFPMIVASGSNYSVIALAQPSNPAQNCQLTNGGGTVTNESVTNIEVACSTAPDNPPTISGNWNWVANSSNAGQVMSQIGGNLQQTGGTLQGFVQVANSTTLSPATAIPVSGTVSDNGNVSLSGTQSAETLSITGSLNTDGSWFAGQYSVAGTPLTDAGTITGFQPPPASGDWSGTFTSDDVAGNTIQVSVDLTATPTSDSAQFLLTGPGTITELGPCGPSGISSFNFAGQQTGSGITLTASEGGQSWIQFSGAISPDGSTIAATYGLVSTNSACTTTGLGEEPTGAGSLVNSEGATKTLEANLEEELNGAFTMNVINYYPSCWQFAIEDPILPCPTSSDGYFSVYAEEGGYSPGILPPGEILYSGYCPPVLKITDQYVVCGTVTIPPNTLYATVDAYLSDTKPPLFIPCPNYSGPANDLCDDTSISGPSFAPSQLPGPYPNGHFLLFGGPGGGGTLNFPLIYSCSGLASEYALSYSTYDVGCLVQYSEYLSGFKPPSGSDARPSRSQ